MERCGIILAARDDARFQSLVRRPEGDALPKQYVNFIGPRSLLEQTFDRAERLIPSHRLFTVAGRHHLSHREAISQLVSRPKGTVILQPENKETAAELLLPLTHVYARYPESVIVVFP
ncbi:MAG TPA: hypothetical protein VFG95_05550, partial [Nitrospiria bacterium]|nr:hypothetical protein [Nitrospiria bacterium]